VHEHVAEIGKLKGAVLITSSGIEGGTAPMRKKKGQRRGEEEGKQGKSKWKKRKKREERKERDEFSMLYGKKEEKMGRGKFRSRWIKKRGGGEEKRKRRPIIPELCLFKGESVKSYRSSDNLIRKNQGGKVEPKKYWAGGMGRRGWRKRPLLRRY